MGYIAVAAISLHKIYVIHCRSLTKAVEAHTTRFNILLVCSHCMYDWSLLDEHFFDMPKIDLDLSRVKTFIVTSLH